MATETITLKGKPGQNDIQLAVGVVGNDLTVAAGSFIAEGTSYTLAEPTTYAATPEGGDRHINGYLAEVLADGSAIVIIDEIDPGETAFQWSSVAGTYRCLFALFALFVPGGAALQEVTGRIYRVVPEESRMKKGEVQDG